MEPEYIYLFALVLFFILGYILGAWHAIRCARLVVTNMIKTKVLAPGSKGRHLL